MVARICGKVSFEVGVKRVGVMNDENGDDELR